jgi:uncharacterized protein
VRITRPILLPLGIFLLWNVAGGLTLFYLPPLLGVPLAAVLFWWVIEIYLLGGAGRRAERAVWLRLRPPARGTVAWTVAAIPVLLVLSWCLGELYLQLVPVPEEQLNPYAPLLARTETRLLLSVFAIAAAPVLEEMVFRGAIQRHLEGAVGVGGGILFAAFLFAGVHLQPWLLPLHLFLGLAFGWTVYATGSLWTGIILHAANNVAAMLTLSLVGTPERAPTVWEAAPDPGLWVTVAVLAGAGFAAAWVGRGLWRAGEPLRAATRLADPDSEPPS